MLLEGVILHTEERYLGCFLFNFYAGMIAHAETLNRSILLEGMILHTRVNDFKFQKFGWNFLCWYDFSYRLYAPTPDHFAVRHLRGSGVIRWKIFRNIELFIEKA